MTWNPIQQPVDYVLLQGERSPGIAEIVGANSPRMWDKQQSYGYGGAILRFKGLDLSKFNLNIRLYDAKDWTAWDEWKKIVDKPPSMKRPTALDIWHPFTQTLGINKVVVLDVKQPAQEADGVWLISIELSDFRELKLSLTRPPEGSKAGEKPTDPYDVKIDQLASSLAARTMARE